MRTHGPETSTHSRLGDVTALDLALSIVDRLFFFWCFCSHLRSFLLSCPVTILPCYALYPPGLSWLRNSSACSSFFPCSLISMTSRSSPSSASPSYSVYLAHILKSLYYACVYYIINHTIHSIARPLSIYYSSVVSLVIIVIIYTTTPDFT